MLEHGIREVLVFPTKQTTTGGGGHCTSDGSREGGSEGFSLGVADALGDMDGIALGRVLGTLLYNTEIIFV